MGLFYETEARKVFCEVEMESGAGRGWWFSRGPPCGISAQIDSREPEVIMNTKPACRL